ncbi:cellulose biosynthesis cyclic di-GMP-binding regulatory protein BcsB [Skermanella mucosa]|uniref:cellulose biosynthesis cyclic di-GMP-binding regulatory protein BcsB n=1 Tax=Skermanella mucosa TaxID=1789672 RepID=UPI00192CC9F4|nr:cellulose biosynthesis cyclic di-GMP-binding regulatory protein BcsB [Skermanella mucosa]UEM20497.1 cellulose biosynthesis cyclic di-GMP-binding regulatory protein BcsB [Skermanella mucosa]
MVNRLYTAKMALMIGLGAVLCQTAGAAAGAADIPAAPVVATAAEPAGTDLRVIPLRAVDHQGGQLELRGQAGQLQFRVPVEAGTDVRDARLRLVYQTADAVVSERSRMWVYLNQQGIAQLPLTGGDDALRADIVLPPELLVPGQNQLSLWVQQENSRGCDADSSAALWTRLDPANSYIALETLHDGRDRTLAGLADPASFFGAGAERIELLTPAGRTGATLKAGALVAQGFSLRMPDSGIAVRHRTAEAGTLTGRDGKVLIGTVEALRGLVAAFGDLEMGGIGDLDMVAGPHVALRGMPGAGPLLIVTGRNDAEVLAAASAFADPSAILPASADWEAGAVRRPERRTRPLQEPGRSYRFRELQAVSGGISNGTEARTGLELNLPADTLPAGGRKILLELDYSYAPNLSPNSVVNVLVNGRYASMVALNDPNGATAAKQRVLLPIDRLRPGTNTIAFEPMIGSDDASGCLVRPGAGRSVAISGESVVTIPDMPRVASLPDLQLFASGGFPYTGVSDTRSGPRRDFDVVLTADDDGTIGGAWTLLAKLARTAGHPIDNFTIGSTSRYGGDVLMVGPAGGLDGRIASGLPTVAGSVRDALRPAPAPFEPGAPFFPGLSSGPGAAPVIASPGASRGATMTASMAEFRMVEQAIDWTAEMSREFRETLWPDRYGRAAPSLSAIDEGSALMTAFENPLRSEGTVTLITAASSEVVEEGIAALVRPALWDRLSGGTVAWNPGTLAMQSWAAEESYRVGTLPDDWRQRILFVNALFARNPVAWIFLALAGLLVMTVLTQVALNRRQDS